MISYRSKNGKASNVIGFEPGDDYILIKFRDSKTRKYTYNSAGRTGVEEMKRLASSCLGLTTYMMQNKLGFE